jgi:hypothetical protein
MFRLMGVGNRVVLNIRTELQIGVILFVSFELFKVSLYRSMFFLIYPFLRCEHYREDEG